MRCLGQTIKQNGGRFAFWSFKFRKNLLDGLSENEVKLSYRFGRESIQFVCDLLTDNLERATLRNNAFTMSMEEQVLVALRFFEISHKGLKNANSKIRLFIDSSTLWILKKIVFIWKCLLYMHSSLQALSKNRKILLSNLILLYFESNLGNFKICFFKTFGIITISHLIVYWTQTQHIVNNIFVHFLLKLCLMFSLLIALCSFNTPLSAFNRLSI